MLRPASLEELFNPGIDLFLSLKKVIVKVPLLSEIV